VEEYNFNLILFEEHRDLVVRVAGYSAVFVELNKAVQDDIIRRTEFAQV